jgi:hypothetical protein
MIEIPFKTTKEQRSRIENIRMRMIFTYLPSCTQVTDITSRAFIRDACDLAYYDQGVYDLLELWDDNPKEEERHITINYITQTIQEEDVVNPNWRIDVREYKNELKEQEWKETVERMNKEQT